MPLYAYGCKDCNKQTDGFSSVEHRHISAPVCECGQQMKLEIMPTYVIGDIAPYRAVTFDVKDEKLPAEERKPPIIGGRKAHKEFLKRNRLVEVGDAPIQSTAKMRSIHKPKDKRELRAQMRPIIREAIRKGSR